jgi:hypothetical protein
MHAAQAQVPAAPADEPATVHSSPAAPAAPAATGEAAASSDSNLPASVVRQQAAEIAKGDPPRWYRADNDLSAQMRSRRKEIAAGLQEALGACRKLASSERRACQQEARTTYQQEMAALRAGTLAGR